MAIVTVDELVAEGMAGRRGELFMDRNIRSTRSNPGSGAGAATVASNSCTVEAVPASLPGGATHVLLEAVELHEGSALPIMLYEAFLMGELDYATGTFTDGVVAPTRLAGGLSQQLPLSLWCECATDMVSQRVVTVTYTDQDGNTGQVSTSHTLTVNSLKHSGFFVVLAVADVGVLDVTNVTATGGTTPTGTLKFWGVNPITILPTLGAATPTNLLAEGVVRRLEAGTKPRAMRIGGQTLTRAFGQITYVVDTP